MRMYQLGFERERAVASFCCKRSYINILFILVCIQAFSRERQIFGKMCKIIEIQSLTFIYLCNIISTNDFCKILVGFKKGQMTEAYIQEDLNGQS